MKVVFIGCVEFSLRALETAIEAGAEVVGVITRKESAYNSDFADVGAVAEAHGIDCLYTAKVNEPESLAWVRDKAPDVIFCFGWSALIGKELLEMPRLGCVGFHPAKLPANRGRHPLIWALALGLESTGTTFFFMEEGADSGDILSQSDLPIRYEDDAASLYDRMIDVALAQVRDFVPCLADGTYERVPQDHNLANTWRKRGKDDGRIDFRMDSKRVYDHVRALARPYPGAHVETANGDVSVWKVREVAGVPENFEPGKVIGIAGERIIVKCGAGAVELMEHDFKVLPAQGEYL